MSERKGTNGTWGVRSWLVALALVVSGYGVLAQLTDGPRRHRRWEGARARTDIAAILAALDEYAILNAQKYPGSLLPLFTPDENGNAYLETTSHKVPVDPWQRPYLYDPPGPARANPRVWSLGRDGKPGGIGDDADVDSDKLRLED